MNDDQMPSDGVVFHAGFPNSAEDSSAQPAALSLDRLAVPHPASTYFWKLAGPGMPDLGLAPDTILVIDKSQTPRHGDWVVVVVEEEFVLRNIQRTDKGVRLFDAAGIQQRHGNVVLWGVVTYALRPMRST